MTVRISVTYPATDGSMPENVEVEWDLPGSEIPHDAFLRVLIALLTAPGNRAAPFDSGPLGFRAWADISVGQWAGALAPGDDVHPLGVPGRSIDGIPTDKYSHLGVAVTDLKRGDTLTWGPSEDMSVKTMTWRKAEQ